MSVAKHLRRKSFTLSSSSAICRYLASLLVLASCSVVAESVQRAAIMSPLASKVLLTDSTRLPGGRYVGVGLYGSVVYSDDAKTWTQGNSPTQVLLTNVFFIDDQLGWAGAHDTLILHTTDGGENWAIQYEDPIPGGDIPKPILDILFTDKNTGYAVGAYGLLLKTADGGKNWESVDTLALYDRLEELEMEPEPNFNYLLAFDGNVLIVGELGTLLSFDPEASTEEERWQIVDSPYSGTFFGAKQLSSGDLYLYGLRGTIYRSADSAQSWQKIQTDVIANIYGCIEMPDGKLVFLGSSGTVLTLAPGGARTEKQLYKGFDTQVSAELVSGNDILLFGGRGVQPFKIK
ncbi:MAG: hypothetical protein KUG71_13470 [Porticoccaceae bacterium]|nr:hypothetical protein [Porticoccaceae bacterium]